MKLPEKYSRWLIAFVFGVALIAVYKTFDNIAGVFSGIGRVISAFRQVIAGFIVAYILNIPIRKVKLRLERINNKYVNKYSFGISITVVYIAAFAALVVMIRSVIPHIMQSISDLYYNYDTYVNKAIDFLNSFDVIKNSGIVNADAIYSKVEEFFGSMDQSTISRYAAGVYNFTYSILKGIIAVIISVYMLIDGKRMTFGMTRFLGLFFKKQTVGNIIRETQRVNDIFTNYIYSRLICCVIMALIAVPVLYILGVRYALVLGVFLGACDLIPYFGSIFGSIFLVVINLLTGGQLWQTVWLAVVLVVLQQVDGNIIAPRVMSSKLELRPLTIMCAVIVGGNLFGVFGMVIAVPLIAVAKGVYNDIYADKRKKKKKTVPEDVPAEADNE